MSVHPFKRQWGNMLSSPPVKPGSSIFYKRKFGLGRPCYSNPVRNVTVDSLPDFFSEWGAVQLLRDFVSLREWIRTETFLAEEARKGILQLEILKRCEGVAFLLLRSPGDVLGVGKQLRKTRRISSNAPPVPTTGELKMINYQQRTEMIRLWRVVTTLEVPARETWEKFGQKRVMGFRNLLSEWDSSDL